MKIAVASDHRGFQMKSLVLALLTDLGHDARDLGPNSDESVDYPDFAARVAEQVSRGEVDRGVLICGTGIGMCITANKFPHVRAATCHDELSAEASRRHNDVNVLCLSGDLLGEQLAARIVETWLKAEFEAGRHLRRIEKIDALECSMNGTCQSTQPTKPTKNAE
jgi:ribose 5-phosphate isomerase B